MFATETLLPLDTDHCRQQPMFCQVFPGRIMGQSMLALALCELLLSPSSLSWCGHRPKVWAFRHSAASRLCSSCSHHAPAAMPVPVPVLPLASSPAGLELSLEPQSSASTRAAGEWLLCSPARDSLSFWPILVALLSPKPHISMPAPIWSGVMSCTSSLCSRFIFMFLPCPRSPSSLLCSWNPALPSAFLPHLVQIALPVPKLYPTKLYFQNNTRSQLPSAALPVPPPLSAPKALCCPHTCTTPPTSSLDSMSPVHLSTNWAQSHVLYHDCLVAHKKLNTDTSQTSVICGLFSKDEHSVYALLSIEIYLSVCQIGMKWSAGQDFKYHNAQMVPGMAGLYTDLLWFTLYNFCS